MTGSGETERAFLGVEQSLSGQKWVARLDQAGENKAISIAQTTGLPDIVARVLAGRGVAMGDAVAFLDPTIKALMPDPSRLTDCDRAAERLALAIARRQRVAIFGDYDVDGAASSALMQRFFNHFGLESEIYIPDRIFEGYGPNAPAIAELIERGAGLIVTVDCGSTSHEALGEAAQRGVDVVVIDHHQMAAELPPAHALVNPNREDDLSGLGHLCACGVVFMVLAGTLRLLRQQGDARVSGFDLLSCLDLVALATVCDVVPLKGLNRAFVVKGLLAARGLGNPGLAALCQRAGVNGPISPYHLGFLIGPRINAGGRIGDAALGSRLLALDDPAEAQAIAERLEELNRERQAIEAAMLEEADAEAATEMQSGEGPAVIVTARQGWHPGVVGLLASRLKERYRRPAFAIAFDGNGKGTGSGRSVPGLDIGRLVRKAVESGLLAKGGGHAMAAGLTIEKVRLGDLRSFFEEEAADTVAQLDAAHRLKIDGALAASGVTLDLADMIERAGPFGAGHSQPVFAVPNHILSDVRVVGQNHVKLTLSGPDGGKLNGIAFRAADTEMGAVLLGGRGLAFHFAGSISVDHWQGVRRVQIRVTDAASVR
ncbi:single-stranded-DNA-specific exonuclease RecJ [Hoeflea phototrophica DFL-43]|uniref:Single-stranded-DNA-specific exonuclease RecJ n=1 Tax=Hoeflea phototrophica (strain DSM 17068 / NCIMB 14078 / DFL-43) TaxID=411684 RepID=A9D5G5_HOEPD|nr:single-stranded-DNA-specific exonuclease RecJ [Hoeflea phototrophica]EDQ33301.2 single-stranded-DNA-specific exonuclease RecJ [Hoeflea phototrophica DFL-43]